MTVTTKNRTIAAAPARRISVTLPLMAAIGLLSGGCEGREVAALEERQQATRQCPDPPCEVPDPTLPGDPPEEPQPPRPPQPDPAKHRKVRIPTDFVTGALILALTGTRVQITHTGGESITLPRSYRTCSGHPGPNVDECKESCRELPPKQQGECRADCEKIDQTCTNQCGVAVATSFIRWSEGAKHLSARATCDSRTCPACPVPTEVPSLKDSELTVPIYRKTIPTPPWEPDWIVTCKMNRWGFVVTPNIAVTSSDHGITVRVSATTGSPSVLCENAPDISVSNPVLALTFTFPSLSPALVLAEGALEGTFSTSVPFVDLLADFDGRMKNAIKEAARERLNAPRESFTFRGLFRDLLDQFVTVHGLEPVDFMGTIRSNASGLEISYIAK
jgi:hypothetical protein